MKAVRNTTRKPLSVPLPRGKVLHLGPGKTGQIASSSIEHRGLAALLASGALEVIHEDHGSADGSGGGGGRLATQSYAPSRGGRRSGDR